jgi:hypothetical protein
MSALSRYLADDDPTVTAPWVAKQLGHKGSDALLEAYLQDLVDELGFPRPLPHWKWGGGISKDIDARRSRWRREAVIAWLDDYLPPDAALAIDAAAMADAADEMDRAAGSLALVDGTDFPGEPA